MPIISVSLRKGTTLEYRQAISESIQHAMIDVLKLPEDDYFQITHELEPGNMVYDPNYYGIKRGDRGVFIQFVFNQRAASVKQALFAATVANLMRNPGMRQEDIYMNIIECAPENWWAYAREVNPVTGTDARMS